MKLNERAQAVLDNSSPSDANQYKSKEEFFSNLGIAEEQEIKGGKCIVKLRLPAQYLMENASKDRKKSCEIYKSIAKGISENGYGVMVLPALVDENGAHMFDMEIIKVL